MSISVSSKRASSGTASLKSSTGSTTQLDGVVGNDLAYRMSLTGKAEEQTEGLKRVPSIGGTSELDLTIPDTEFFGNGNSIFFRTIHIVPLG